MMTGSNEPTGGRVFVAGTDIHRVKYRERDRLAIHYHQSYQVRRFRKLVPSFMLAASPSEKPMVHLFDEPQFNPQDGYIGFMLDFFRKLRAEGRLVFVCLHPTASYHLEILSEIAERFLLVSNGGVTPHADFQIADRRRARQDLSRAGDDPRRRDAGMSGFGNGQVALVTGAAGAMGLATARMLAAEGYRVAMADLAGAKLDAAVAGDRRVRARLRLRCVGPGGRGNGLPARSKASSARSTC